MKDEQAYRGYRVRSNPSWNEWYVMKDGVCVATLGSLEEAKDVIDQLTGRTGWEGARIEWR